MHKHVENIKLQGLIRPIVLFYTLSSIVVLYQFLIVMKYLVYLVLGKLNVRGPNLARGIRHLAPSALFPRRRFSRLASHTRTYSYSYTYPSGLRVRFLHMPRFSLQMAVFEWLFFVVSIDYILVLYIVVAPGRTVNDCY